MCDADVDSLSQDMSQDIHVDDLETTLQPLLTSTPLQESTPRDTTLTQTQTPRVQQPGKRKQKRRKLHHDSQPEQQNKFRGT